MSDSVEEVKVEETQNVVAEVTGVTEPVKDDLIEKIKRDLGLENTEKEETPKKSEEITAEVVEDMKARVEQLEAKKADLEAKKADLEAKMSELEAENAELEAENAKLQAEESEEDNEAADTPDEEGSEEGEVEDEDEEDDEEEEEEGEVEDEEETEEEKRVRYMAIVIREKNNEIPFPIICAGSLLVIVYMFKAFLILCAMTGCNKNGVCLA
jgi:hypothetical protein